MPDHINIALRVGGYRTSTIESVAISDHVALRSERGAGVIEPGIEERFLAPGAVVASVTMS